MKVHVLHYVNVSLAAFHHLLQIRFQKLRWGETVYFSLALFILCLLRMYEMLKVRTLVQISFAKYLFGATFSHVSAITQKSTHQTNHINPTRRSTFFSTLHDLGHLCGDLATKELTHQSQRPQTRGVQTYAQKHDMA